MSTRGIVPCQYTKKYCVWIKKKPSIATWLFYIYFSFFGDIFLRLHLRDLCYTGHNERLKNRDYFSFHIYIRLTLCYNVFSRGILWLKFGRVFNSSPTPSAKTTVQEKSLCIKKNLDVSRAFLFLLLPRSVLTKHSIKQLLGSQKAVKKRRG